MRNAKPITMKSFTTIKTFMFPSESYILKGRLESEGVNCYLKDELQVQTNPLNSNAIGGVKLQVQSDQLEDAKRILEENGIKLEIEDELNPLYFKLINLANAVPGVNKLPETIKVLIIFLFFVVIMIGLISLVLNVLYE